MIYTVIDVETAGPGNKLTEISIFKYDNNLLVDEFTSLINPEQPIPEFITALTGIDDYMVAKAPTFAQIAEQILSITANAVFIAHNVNFDYNAIRNEFTAIGIKFTRKKLCTVRLARKLLPGHKSYSLGKLCRALNIPIIGRHRAKGDVEATVILFKLMLEQPNSEVVIQSFFKKNSKINTLPKNLNPNTFEQLPNSTGIYYFKDKKDVIIYIGKAKDIKKRILSHFYSKAQKELNLAKETADIHFELSGSETIAQLMEDAAIKQHFPKYNQLAKRAPKTYAIFSYQDRNGIIHSAYNTQKATPNPIQILYSIQECRQYLELLCSQYNLCPKYCHLEEGVAQCSHYSIKTCKGICDKKESIALYNLRVKQAIEYLKNRSKHIILKQPGRSKNEEAFILIENSNYKGYGFIDKYEQINNPEDLKPFLIPQNNNIDIQRVLTKLLINPKLSTFKKYIPNHQN